MTSDSTERGRRRAGDHSGMRSADRRNRANLLVVEHASLVRDGLRLILLDAAFGVDEASSAGDYFANLNVPAPDLVLWGPGISAQALARDFEVIRSRAATTPVVRLVVLTSELKRSALRRVAALDPDAILMNDISSEVLRRSLDLVFLGQRLYPPDRRGARSDVAGTAAMPAQIPPLAPIETPIRLQAANDIVLSWRESEILMQLRDGVPNKTIAKNLGIAEATVKVHVKSVFRKIRTTNRTQAALWALNNRHLIIDAVVPRKAPNHHASE